MELTSMYFLLAIACLATFATGQSLIENCLSFENPYICKQCATGMDCCTPHCVACVDQIQCLRCESFYNLNPQTGICVWTNGCTQENGRISCSTDNVCTECIATTYLSPLSYECLPCQDNCDICSSNSLCTMCSNGFYLNSSGICVPCISNCASCKSSNTCMFCNSGYVVNASGVCLQCPASCSVCSSPTVCVQCVNSYYLNINQQCSPCSGNCETCQGISNNCTSCYKGRNLVNGTCINCAYAVPNCSECSVSSSTIYCSICNEFFYLTLDSKCLACPQNCYFCSGPNSCSSCVQGYYFNSTLNICQLCTFAHCELCSNENSCTNCEEGYFLNLPTGTCEICGEGCSACLGLGHCMGCTNQYFLIRGLCYPCSSECDGCTGVPHNCTFCQDGYFKVTGLDICYPCPAFCPDCLDSENCWKCLPGYYLSGKICKPCSVDKCFDCSSQGDNVCSLCNTGYYVSQNKKQCLLCMDNCEVCTNATTCLSCLAGYYSVNTNECFPCPNNCSICSSKQCSYCVQGYYHSEQGDCLACPTGCSTCIQPKICTRCDEGYYLQIVDRMPTGNCLPCAQECKGCLDGQSLCTSCAVGRYLSSSGVCSFCEEGCLHCHEQLGCLACQFNYVRVLQDNSTWYHTCQGCQQNCLSCSVEISQEGITTLPCQQCIFGYTALQDGSCFACGSTPETYGCHTCSPDKTCQKCRPGMAKIQGVCKAQVLTNNSPAGFFLVVIVILSVACTGLIGLAIYQQCSKKPETTLYSQIS